MPKLKTHKGAQARFHITGSGKIMRMQIGKSHLRTHKPKRIKRLFTSYLPLSPKFTKQIERLIPYGIK